MSALESDWPSTRALSVYNVLRLKKETPFVTLDDVLVCLRDFFDPGYREDWVIEGAAWLQKRGFIASTGGQICASHRDRSGVPIKLVRTEGDAELALARAQA